MTYGTLADPLTAKEHRVDRLEAALIKIAARRVGAHLLSDAMPPVDSKYPGHEDMHMSSALLNFSRGMAQAYDDCREIAWAALYETSERT